MKINLKQAAAAAAEILYPRVCPLCGDILPKERAGWSDPFICPECLAKVNFLEGSCRCMKCSHPIEGEAAEYCDECLNRHRYFDSGFVLMAHDDVSRKIIYDMKFRSLKDNADVIGFELARHAGRMAELWGAEALIPVPLHKKRMRQRGFNQTQLIAEKFSECAGELGFSVPAADSGYLIRSAETAPQRKTGESMRASNVEGAFAVNIKDMPYRNVILVDAIFITDATLNECAKTLKQNGTSVVYFLASGIVC